MIKNFLTTIQFYRDKVALILLLTVLPLALALFWTPWWVAVICLLLVPIASFSLIFQVAPIPYSPRRKTDDLNMTDAQIRKMRKMSTNIHYLLSHWSQISTHSNAHIEQVGQYVDEVIANSESAVIQIGNNFIGVTRKTRQQMEYALRLLERIRDNPEYGNEITETLTQISTLGEEIQTDVNNIIVALQFQDMTQQKLQRLKNPLLTDLTTLLRTIVDETRLMSFKLEGSGLVDTHTYNKENNAKSQFSQGELFSYSGTPTAQSEKKHADSESVEIF